jgi:CDP-glycerol glycerophosphotransferase (TagB/SpsB family)
MKSLIRYLGLLAIAPFSWALYALSGLIPKDSDLWVFGAWDGVRFADNTKWLFLHCTTNGYPGRFVWITRDRALATRLSDLGFQAHYHRSLRGIWLPLRAKYYVIDHTSHDINYFTSCRSVKVCVFHGIPLKRLRRDVDIPGTFNHSVYHGPWPLRLLLFLTRPYLYEKYDLVIATSPEIAANYNTAFGTPMDRIAVTGYPRNDVLMNPSIPLDVRDEAGRRHLQGLRERGSKVVMYLPTWRDHARHGSVPLNFQALADLLEEHDAVFVTKFHSYDDRSAGMTVDHERLVVLNHEADVYPLLSAVDVLVTDYSSVAFDFLLLHRPVVYYCYDLAEYTASARGMYHQYDEVTPGAKAVTFAELAAGISQALAEGGRYQAQFERAYAHTMRLCHTYRDPGSSARVYHEIRQRFGRH